MEIRELTGIYHKDMSIKEINSKFRKRVFIVKLLTVTADKEYVNYAKMELTQGKCEILDRFKVGNPVKALFNIKGIEKYYPDEDKYEYITNLDAYRVEKLTGEKKEI